MRWTITSRGRGFNEVAEQRTMCCERYVRHLRRFILWCLLRREISDTVTRKFATLSFRIVVTSKTKFLSCGICMESREWIGREFIMLSSLWSSPECGYRIMCYSWLFWAVSCFKCGPGRVIYLCWSFSNFLNIAQRRIVATLLVFLVLVRKFNLSYLFLSIKSYKKYIL